MLDAVIKPRVRDLGDARGRSGALGGARVPGEHEFIPLPEKRFT